MGKNASKQQLHPSPSAVALDIHKVLNQTKFKEESLKELVHIFEQNERKGHKRGLNHKKLLTILPNYIKFSADWPLLLNAFDTVSNNHMKLDEMIPTLSVLCAGTYRDRLKILFKAFDVNKDGTISKEDKAVFKSALEKVYNSHERDYDIDQILNALQIRDADKPITTEDWILQGTRFDIVPLFIQVNPDILVSNEPGLPPNANPTSENANSFFGVSLEMLKNRSENSELFVPYCVTDMIKFLAEYGLNTEGLFRVTGRGPNYDQLVKSYTSGERAVISREVFTTSNDIHSVASALKQFLRLMPEPLFPSRFYDLFLEIQSEENKDFAVLKAKELVSYLPPCHLKLFIELFRLMCLVADNSESTKMNSRNLAIVFSPTIFRPEVIDLKKMSKDAEITNSLTKLILDEFAIISGEVPTAIPVDNTDGEHPSQLPDQTTSLPEETIPKTIQDEDYEEEGLEDEEDDMYDEEYEEDETFEEIQSQSLDVLSGTHEPQKDSCGLVATPKAQPLPEQSEETILKSKTNGESPESAVGAEPTPAKFTVASPRKTPKKFMSIPRSETLNPDMSVYRLSDNPIFAADKEKKTNPQTPGSYKKKMAKRRSARGNTVASLRKAFVAKQQTSVANPVGTLRPVCATKGSNRLMANDHAHSTTSLYKSALIPQHSDLASTTITTTTKGSPRLNLEQKVHLSHSSTNLSSNADNEDCLDELKDFIITEFSYANSQESVEEIQRKILKVVSTLRLSNLVTAPQIAALRPADYWKLGIPIPVEINIHIFEWLNIRRFGFETNA
eukprot:TRINITY_DN11067_c0_g1_i1.p1 TRINITY_DN11067_c0_g1~~TRINITY_DN11067_c0_g1_i1.p1  ORF type:complete len:788 (-),score=222.89 TRINITY_DN11067_c0_g1_i1:56-2419(-)